MQGRRIQLTTRELDKSGPIMVERSTYVVTEGSLPKRFFEVTVPAPVFELATGDKIDDMILHAIEANIQ